MTPLLHPARLALAATVALSPLAASASLALAQQKACMACHATDKKLVGPAYQDVAKKYGGQKDAEATLARSIKAGGSGRWGAVPMPAQPGLSDSEAQALAAWVLAGAR